jgi:hypothetical protein
VKQRNTSSVGVFIKAVCDLIESQQFPAGDISELGVEPTEYTYWLTLLPRLKCNVPTYIDRLII